MSSILDLLFFQFISRNVKKFRLSFRNLIENIEKDKMAFSIPDTVFKHGKDKATIHLSLYDEKNRTENYKFHVYYGKNSAYVQTDRLSKNVYEIILKNLKGVKISEYGQVFTELDDLGNKDRQRLTLINYSQNIEINDNIYDLSRIVLQNTLDSEILFNQISVLDLEKRLFIIQPIKDKTDYDIEFLKDNMELLLTFETKFNDFFNSSNYSNIGNELINTFQKIKAHGSLSLNRSNEYLNNIFNSNKFLDLELFWNYSLCIFFLDNNFEKLYKNKEVVQALILKIKEIKNNLVKIKQLSLYEKVRTAYTLFTVFFIKKVPFDNLNEINNLNLRIILTDERENDSIMDRSYQMYNEFVNNISEESAIFPYLVNIDGGCGFYNKESVYTFDLKNLNMIKDHLRQVYPKVIIFCYVENGEEAITEPEFGGIIINDYHLTKFKNLNYNSSSLKDITEEQKNDIAVNIFLKKIHEASGHKKYGLSEEDYNSPIKFFNKNNEIITLKHESLYVSGDNKCEYILRSYNKTRGDSGHYLELCYGKYKNKLIIAILREMEDKGNLINYPRLFTDDGQLLYKYVFLRKKIEENGIKFISKNKTPIEDEIKQMEKDLENNKIKKEEISHSEEPNRYKLLGKGKRKREDVNIEDDEIGDNKMEENNEEDNNNTQNKNKEYTPNYLKATNKFEKEDLKKENAHDEDKVESDKEQYLTIEERVNNTIKRVSERFKIEIDCLMKGKLKKIMKKLDINDPYFLDVSFLLSFGNIKF